MIVKSILSKSLTPEETKRKVKGKTSPGGGGVNPIITYRGRLRPKGVPFSGFRYMKGYGFYKLRYIKG